MRTEDHDFEVKVKHIQRFLYDGDNVKVVVQMRGREQAHPELAEQMLARVAFSVNGVGLVKNPPKRDGRLVHLLMTPNPSRKRAG